MKHSKTTIIILLLASCMLLLIVANLLCGSVKIPADEIFKILTGDETSHRAWEIIILQSRIPMIINAAFAGAALAVAGLLLQTLFHNPLADPSILGISTGASLGVAVVMLAGTTIMGALWGISSGGYLTMIAGAVAGAMIVLAILLLLSQVIHSTTMLLIVGILLSYLTSSAISLLNFFATQEGVHSFVIWGLGSFNGVTLDNVGWPAGITTVVLLWSMTMIKPLNALLLGDRSAASLGINIKSVRTRLLLITGILTAVVTTFCGPISFIGLVVPHIARLMLRTTNHNSLLPVTMLTGAVLTLLCCFISVLPPSGTLPINAITPIIGLPVILYIVLNRRHIKYFN